MASAQTNNQAGDQNPADGISIWTGFIATIPLGWKLCDGTNGTPDLRDRFVRGVPAATNPGATGGVSTVTITTGNMSSHLHSGTGTSHNHQGEWSAEASGGGQANTGLGAGETPVQSVPQSNSTKIVNTVQSQGGGGPHNNIPQFFSVLYMMKE